MVFFDKLLDKVNSLNQTNVENNENSPWDPVNGYYAVVVKQNCDKLEKKYEKLKNNPNKPRYVLGLFLVLIILSILLCIFICFTFIFLLFILSIIFFIIYLNYKSIIKDLIKNKIAKDYGWFYDPYNSSFKWNILRRDIPEIFNKGNERQYVEDQFWGKFKHNGLDYDFYQGVFSYTHSSGHGKNKSSKTYNTHFFILKNHKQLNNEFLLYPNGFFSKFINFFSKKNIKTSSIEFNKSFAFTYNGKKIENQNDILNYINPKVQTLLIDIKKKKGSFSVLFKKDYTVFLFNGFLIKKLKTNFIKSIEIKQEDYDFVNNELKFLIENTREILHHLH
ncbi:MAG: hypothetical protein ACOC3X_00910 [Nanoarchaeota archaeon]